MKKRIAFSFLGVVFISMITVIVIGIRNNKETVIPANLVVLFDGAYYELIVDRSVLTQRGVKATINSDQVGKYIGDGRFISGGEGIIKVYDYSPLKGNSVMVTEYNGEYRYLLFCNLEDDTIEMKELLSRFGIKDKIEHIMIDGNEIQTDGKEVLGEFLKMTENSNDPGALIENKRSGESPSNLSHVQSIEIRNSDSDVLIFLFYPQDKLLYSSNTYYSVTTKFMMMVGE